MNYTPCCGKKAIRSSENKFECPQCGNTHYINPKGATAIFLWRNGKLLLGRRGVDPHKGKLDAIGGFLDVGENFEQGAVREMAEESGLLQSDISRLEYFGSTYDAYPWNDGIVPVTSVYFKADVVSSAILTAADDIAEIIEVDIKTLKREHVAWDGLWTMIERLRLE